MSREERKQGGLFWTKEPRETDASQTRYMALRSSTLCIHSDTLTEYAKWDSQSQQPTTPFGRCLEAEWNGIWGRWRIAVQKFSYRRCMHSKVCCVPLCSGQHFHVVIVKMCREGRACVKCPYPKFKNQCSAWILFFSLGFFFFFFFFFFFLLPFKYKKVPRVLGKLEVEVMGAPDP